MRHIGQLHTVVSERAGAVVSAAGRCAVGEGQAVLAAHSVAVSRAVGSIESGLHHHQLQGLGK